jgi:predicted ArsR family transcriptional regulator
MASAISTLQRRLLDELDEPESAAGLAARLGLPRQKVNYHLRELERDGLVELVEERRRRGFVERRLRSTARDRFSSAYLVRAASRLADDVATLRRAAAEADQPLLTLTAETEIRFESPAELKAFARDLTRLVAKYDRPELAQSRSYRAVVGLHPTITKGEQ